MATSKRTTRGNNTTRPETTTPETTRPENGAAPRAKTRARATKSRSSASAATTAHPSGDRHASIAQAAYFRSQHRGFLPGYEVEDWLAAEAEVDLRLRGESRISGDPTD